MDLVRESPKTTGELVELVKAFADIKRCAVMKHLAVLEKANLIIPKKKGKYRWNHINAIPLQEAYERWVKKYESQWARQLVELRKFVEDQEVERNLLTTNNMETTANSLNILMEIPIQVGIQQVWDCLIKDISIWWRKDFHSSPKTKKFILEPKIGGRMYEDYGNDEGLLWANVIVLDSPQTLELKGHLTPEFGGPAVSFLKLSLKEDGENTILTLSDTVFGEVSEASRKSLQSGWELLFAESFKNYAERSK
ncbi:UNVERIFIED_CONTAM: hypothetical protein GTU68_054583 [Idotea baltica]|nr:hypothetical protein [Idotea baltica]